MVTRKTPIARKAAPKTQYRSQTSLVDWMKERTGEWPVILLDEVMAELDAQRRADLLKYVGASEQVLFTTTDLALFTPEFAGQAAVWQVTGGKITK